MWVIAEYEATTLFSLKPASATASGGRTLLVPTPFAIKMALLDIVCRTSGVTTARAVWVWLSPAQVAIRPPRYIVVNNTFLSVLRPRRTPATEGSVDRGQFGRTLAYREFAQYDSTFAIAIYVEQNEQAEALQHWLIGINYLGKRGSFLQVQAVPEIVDALPGDFIAITGEMGSSFPLDAVLTQLDDTSDNLTFKQANIYSRGTDSAIKLGKDRLLKYVALPYRLVSSSQGYSFYTIVP